MLSKKAQFMLAEATFTTIVGLVHSGAGILLTYGLVFFHLRFDKELSPQSSSIQIISPTKQSENKECPLLKAINEKSTMVE
jgi:hypothetical protein